MTSIEWTEATWNPVTGCDRVSEGCDHCYALALARRLKAMGNPRYQRDGDLLRSGPGFGLTVHWDKLEEPLRWRKPRLVFVNSMSDLFHPLVPLEAICQILLVIEKAREHTFQVLTKRPGRMASVLARIRPEPLPNLWLGTSVENQRWAEVRIPALLRTPAAVRFLSCEPLLGPIDLGRWLPERCNECYEAGCDATELSCACECHRGLNWVIVGGESGPGARPLELDWVRDLAAQCWASGVPLFVKQLGSAWARRVGARHPKGGDPAEWPKNLRVRQWPLKRR